MSSEDRITFTKDNLDTYLKELAKEYRRLSGKKLPAEFVLLGGASVLINYGFRDMTTDVDALIQAASTMKEAINRVGDKYSLPNGWLNDNVRMTSSYTPKLIQYATYYRTYYGVLTVRTISEEYLIAMKLMSGRQYKNDLSDIVGILSEHRKSGKPITKKRIRKAVEDLYGEWEVLPEYARTFLDDVLRNGNYDAVFARVKAEEKETKEALLVFEGHYPKAVNRENVETIITLLKQRVR